MNNDELKKKIVNVLESVKLRHYIDEDNKIMVTSVIPQYLIQTTADALIAAGLGDLKEHRIFAGKDGSIKQLYSGEEVEKIVKERKELKDELRSKVEYIHEQDEVIKEYKHRAQVAEKALNSACFILAKNYYVDGKEDWAKRGAECATFYREQAERELAEDGKDD